MMKEKQTSGMEWMYSILNGASIAMLVAVLAAIGIMTCMAFASHADAKAKSSNNNSIGEVSFRAGDIKIDATLGGTGGVVAPNRYVPIRATLTNKGDNFKGSVKVISGAVSGTSVAFTKSVSIAAGETIQIKSFFTLPVSGSTVRVALYDKDDDMISSQTAYLQMALTTTDEKQMAVLSDDINKIGYLQSANFAVEEINVADVPEDVRLLESLDVLVINNVDTQSFSAKQVTALQQWVSNGGLLVLGTGAQAEKSLKVFSGKLLNGTIGDARSIQTNLSYAKVDQAEKLALLKEELRKEKLDKVIKSLPYELTVDQKLVLNEILEDLTSKRRMNRLLQGDVGSGKTIISIIAMVANYLSGYQSALMVPTEILATQHYETMKEILKDLNVNIALLTGSLPKNKKDLIHEELKLGKIDMVVGTHALIQEEVVYKNLGLVITDEQHRFGVLQRTSLQNKGITPDVLYMSATPIPRTYALTLYGDMDISTIRTLPKGRKPIKTYLKSYSEIKDVLKMMYEELLKNHQIYVIAPLIEESETLDLTTVNELKDKMNLAFGEKYNVGIIHGKLKQTEKDKIMDDFVNNKIQILISTTVIEVGVNVLNTTMMVIFDANRFGLSTLHQLRGRVGRSALESSCILISDYDSERLNVMTTTNDGFEISEEDFKIRGHGDLFGTKQSGDMTFKIADIKEDYKILLQAKKDSMDFLLNNKEEELKEKIINGIKEG